MRYLLLIYNQEANFEPPAPDNLETAMKPWWEYQGWLEEKGWYMGGDALQRTHHRAPDVPGRSRDRDGQAVGLRH